MNDTELRQLFLSLYNILRDHLTVTRNLEEVVEALVSRDPVLQARLENARREESEEARRSDSPQLLNTDELLLQVRQAIHRLSA